MPSLNATAKHALRRAILEKRSEHRTRMTEVEKAQDALQDYMRAYFKVRADIRELQEACGDPIDIDPNFADRHAKIIQWGPPFDMGTPEPSNS